MVRGAYLPNLLLVGGREGSADPDMPLLVDRTARDGLPTAYLCERYVCRAPTTDPEELLAQVAASSS